MLIFMLLAEEAIDTFGFFVEPPAWPWALHVLDSSFPIKKFDVINIGLLKISMPSLTRNRIGIYQQKKERLGLSIRDR